MVRGWYKFLSTLILCWSIKSRLYENTFFNTMRSSKRKGFLISGEISPSLHPKPVSNSGGQRPLPPVRLPPLAAAHPVFFPSPAAERGETIAPARKRACVKGTAAYARALASAAATAATLRAHVASPSCVFAGRKTMRVVAP